MYQFRGRISIWTSSEWPITYLLYKYLYLVNIHLCPQFCYIDSFWHCRSQSYLLGNFVVNCSFNFLEVIQFWWQHNECFIILVSCFFRYVLFFVLFGIFVHSFLQNTCFCDWNRLDINKNSHSNINSRTATKKNKKKGQRNFYHTKQEFYWYISTITLWEVCRGVLLHI